MIQPDNELDLGLGSSTLYSAFGILTRLNLGNTTKTTFGYYGTGGTYDTAGGYYGRLWEIKTTKQPGNTPVLQDLKYTWDEIGNLTLRQNGVSEETEYLSYDFLDRLSYEGESVEVYAPGDADGDGLITEADVTYLEGVLLTLNPVTPGCDVDQNSIVSILDVVYLEYMLLDQESSNYTYDPLGNITSKNGVYYTYGTKPHAVTSVGLKSYTYDANGNMESGDGREITWDAENRPASITKDQITTYFTYDGDGNRVKKDSWWCGNHRSLSPDPFSTGDQQVLRKDRGQCNYQLLSRQ